MDDDLRVCYYCGVQALDAAEPFDNDRELRPYGPGGSWVCFPCANTPERRTRTEAAMRLAFDMAAAASPVDGIVIGPGIEPSPLVPEREAQP